MQLGYYAYGMVDHHLPDAVRILHELGYTSVVLPLGARLNPQTVMARSSTGWLSELEAIVAETGIRLILDTTTPFSVAPHDPRGMELLAADDERWHKVFDALQAAFDVAHRLGSQAMILRTGAAIMPHDLESDLDRLSDRISSLLLKMDGLDVGIALQPSDDHFLHNVSGFVRLLQWIDSPLLQLAVDTATMYRQIEFPLYSILSPMSSRLRYVTFRDPAHRAPAGDWIGQGQVSCDAVVECLSEINFDGDLLVYSFPSEHQAIETARLAIKRLIV